MSAAHFGEQILKQFSETGIVEWLAFVFGVLQVVLAKMNKILNFYAGVVSVLLYCVVFYEYGLYAESALNVYYLIISLLGIFYWQTKQAPAITFSTHNDARWALMILFGSFLLVFLILHFLTNSTVPFADACVSAFAWSGSWLLMKRKVENWMVLNISNVLAIPLLVYKGLPLTAVLTLIYIGVAFAGYYSWKTIATDAK